MDELAAPSTGTRALIVIPKVSTTVPVLRSCPPVQPMVALAAPRAQVKGASDGLLVIVKLSTVSPDSVIGTTTSLAVVPGTAFDTPTEIVTGWLGNGLSGLTVWPASTIGAIMVQVALVELFAVLVSTVGLFIRAVAKWAASPGWLVTMKETLKLNTSGLKGLGPRSEPALQFTSPKLPVPS